MMNQHSHTRAALRLVPAVAPDRCEDVPAKPYGALAALAFGVLHVEAAAACGALQMPEAAEYSRRLRALAEATR